MPLPLYSASRAIRIPELLRHKHTNNSVLRIMAAVKTACTALCIIFVVIMICALSASGEGTYLSAFVLSIILLFIIRGLE